MRLLIDRGPLGQAKPTPMHPEKIEASIDAVFRHLAEPSSSGFCWAAQIRSPNALRRHWHELGIAFKRIQRGAARPVDHTRGRNASLDDLYAQAAASNNHHHAIGAPL